MKKFLLLPSSLTTGTVSLPTERSLKKSGMKDVEKGLSLNLPVVNYTSNKETKDFIVREALKIDPHLKRKSGARYRLNRWREEQLIRGARINYGLGPAVREVEQKRRTFR